MSRADYSWIKMACAGVLVKPLLVNCDSLYSSKENWKLTKQTKTKHSSAIWKYNLSVPVYSYNLDNALHFPMPHMYMYFEKEVIEIYFIFFLWQSTLIQNNQLQHTFIMFADQNINSWIQAFIKLFILILMIFSLSCSKHRLDAVECNSVLSCIFTIIIDRQHDLLALKN